MTILALGDSLTAGYGLPQADSFPRQLELALKRAGHEVRIRNGGVSGDTSAGGRSRIAWALADSPGAVIVALGANDGLRGLAPRETAANLDAIMTAIRAKGLPVLLAGMLAPPNLGAEYGAEFKVLYSRLAEKHRILFYPFFLDGVAAKPELNQEDGIHPNAAGVAEMVRRILPSVIKLIEKVLKRQ